MSGTGAALARQAPLGLATAVLVAAWIPSARARFGLIDDHQIIRILSGRTRLPVTEIPQQVVDHSMEQAGRFRPLYWVGQVVESAWAGDNPTLWYIDRLLLAVLTLSALYAIARHFCSPAWSAVLALGVLLGPQFETWSRLGVAESYAMPLFSIGLLLWLRGVATDDVRLSLGAASALIASALAKESFLPFAAAALAYLALVLRRGAPVRAWLAAGALGVVLVADIAVLLDQLNRFGDQYAQIRTPDTALSWAGFALGNAFVFQAFGFAVLIATAGLRETLARKRGLAFALAGFGSQLGFYAGADHVGRYLLPGAMAFMACWVVALGDGRRLSRAATAVAACTLILGIGLGAVSSFHIAQANSESTRQFQSWLDEVEHQARRDNAGTVILEPVDPYLDYERVLSIAEYLRSDLTIHVMTTATSEWNDERARRIGEDFSRMSAKGTTDGLIEPLSARSGCLSVLLGDVQPICPASVSLP